MRLQPAILRAIPLTVVCAALPPITATAQTPYPAKVVRVVVPFPSGAGVDLVTRIVVPRIAESTKQSFVVDNRAGAGGIVGTEVAMRAPADGYTLLVTGTALVVTPLTTNVSYSARDFTPIARMAVVPFLLVVHPTIPAKSVFDLVALAKAKPGVINLLGALSFREGARTERASRRHDGTQELYRAFHRFHDLSPVIAL